MNTKYYKHYIEKLIKTNPTTIEINRASILEDGYGGTYTDIETIVKEDVTVYDRTNRQYVITDAGGGYRGAGTTMLLARYRADIQKGDIFDMLGYKFKVLLVKPYFDICKQIEIEVVE